MLVLIVSHSPSTHKTLFLLPGAFHFGICSLQSVSRDHGHGALGHNVQDYSRHVFTILLFAATTVESGTWLLQLRLGCRRKGWRRWARWPLIGPGKVMWRVWNGIVWYGMVWAKLCGSPSVTPCKRHLCFLIAIQIQFHSFLQTCSRRICSPFPFNCTEISKVFKTTPSKAFSKLYGFYGDKGGGSGSAF